MAVETNVFRPALVAQSIKQNIVPDAVTETQYANERFLAIATGTANPAFRLTSDRNRLVENGGTIFRGYIRRSSTSASDPTSPYRLYFMYNPETIERGYIAYLDQQALDPGNAMFGSNNLAAAPGILDFNFELLFDRQLEVASDPNHPGTKVDYDYFDIVVRGIVPDSAATGNSIPDNGIMMVNPHNIVVVFGEDLSVQGRVTNAGISFEKFNNHMIPTRLRIQVTMKALYIGPVQTIPNYSMFVSQGVSTATIPYDESVTFKLTSEALKAGTPTVVTAAAAATSTSGFPPSFFVPTGIGGNWLTFGTMVLGVIGATATKDNLTAMLAWMVMENDPTGLVAANNPMNIQTGNYPHIAVTRGGQYIFATSADGENVTGHFLLAGYDSVVAAFRSGNDARAVLNAIQNSPWASSHYNFQLVNMVPMSDSRYNQLSAGVLTQKDPSNSIPV